MFVVHSYCGENGSFVGSCEASGRGVGNSVLSGCAAKTLRVSEASAGAIVSCEISALAEPGSGWAEPGSGWLEEGGRLKGSLSDPTVVTLVEEPVMAGSTAGSWCGDVVDGIATGSGWVLVGGASVGGVSARGCGSGEVWVTGVGSVWPGSGSAVLSGMAGREGVVLVPTEVSFGLAGTAATAAGGVTPLATS